MPTCFAPNCRSGYYKTDEKRHFFRPPANDDQRAAWDRAIPRSDRLLTLGCRLCDLHFDSADIVKVFRHNIRGETVEIPRAKWELRPGAVPRIFSDIPRFLLKRKGSYVRKRSTKQNFEQERPAAANDTPSPGKAAVELPKTSEPLVDSDTVSLNLAYPRNESPRACCVPDCQSGKQLAAQNPDERHYFKPPSDERLFQEWGRSLGRTGDKPLTRTMQVCDLHFDEGDIVKGFRRVVNGKIIVSQRDWWQLKPAAVPSRLLGNGCDKPTPPTTSCVETRCQEKSPEANRGDGSKNNCPGLLLEPASVFTLSKRVQFEDIPKTFASVRATRDWATNMDDDRILFYKLAMSERSVVSIARAVIVAKDLSVCVNSNGRLVPPGLLVANIRTLEDIGGLLNVAGTLRDCSGCPADQFPDITTSHSAVKEGGVWYRKNCTVLAESKTCSECAKLRNLMRQRQKRQKNDPSPPKNTATVVKVLRKKAARASLAKARMSLKLREMKKEMALFAKALRVLPEDQQHSFREVLCRFGEVCSSGEGEQEDKELTIVEDMQSDSDDSASLSDLCADVDVSADDMPPPD